MTCPCHLLERGVTVRPFTEVTSELVPRGSNSAWRGRHKVAVDNRGNTPLPVVLSARGATERAKMAFEPAELTVPPGEAKFATLRVRPTQRLWRGTPITHPFQAVVTPRTGEGQDPYELVVLDGTYEQQAILPRWLPRALAAAVLVAALLVGLWYALLRPTVRSAAREAITPQAVESAVKQGDKESGGAQGRAAGRPTGGVGRRRSRWWSGQRSGRRLDRPRRRQVPRAVRRFGCRARGARRARGPGQRTGAGARRGGWRGRRADRVHSPRREELRAHRHRGAESAGRRRHAGHLQ
ncbi:COG1470 family protein [Streptomyces sp. 6N106]|uniref:COG1470 family protein n=1 Tax=Streptomyces sp. 6N106 TaxID=3457418 RepID=UPI003FD69844